MMLKNKVETDMIFEYIEFVMDISKMNEYGQQGWRYMFTYLSQGNDSGTLYVVMGRRFENRQ